MVLFLILIDLFRLIVLLVCVYVVGGWVLLEEELDKNLGMVLKSIKYVI